MVPIFVVAFLTICVATAAQYTLEPYLSDPYTLAQYALKDYCTQHNKQKSNNGICIGKNAYIDVCSGPSTGGSYNGFGNFAADCVSFRIYCRVL